MRRSIGTYFSTRAKIYGLRLRWRHRRYFKILIEAVKIGKEVLLVARIRRNERQKIVSAALLAYLLDIVQAGALLVQAGLERQAASMVRSAFETFAFLVGCCTEHAFVQKYLASDKVRQLKLVRGALKLSALTDDQRSVLRRREGELAEEVAAADAKQLNIEQVANRFQLANEYNLVYRLTSPQVHATPRALEELAISTPERRLEGLTLGPSDRYAEVYLSTLAEYALRGAGEVGQLAGVDKPTEFDRCLRELHRLDPKWPEET